jgi:hypothetical protein
MKAKLEFELPTEESDYRLCIDAFKWCSVVQEVDQWIRNMLHYNSADGVKLDSLTTPAHALEKVREFLRQEVMYNGLKLDNEL